MVTWSFDEVEVETDPKTGKHVYKNVADAKKALFLYILGEYEEEKATPITRGPPGKVALEALWETRKLPQFRKDLLAVIQGARPDIVEKARKLKYVKEEVEEGRVERLLKEFLESGGYEIKNEAKNIMKSEFKVPRTKAEKQVKVGTTTSGSPAQAEPVVAKKRVLTPEQKANSIKNLAKAREVRAHNLAIKKAPAHSEVPEREAYSAGLKKRGKKIGTFSPGLDVKDEYSRHVKEFGREKRSFKAGLDTEHKQMVSEGIKAGREHAKEMREMAKAYTAKAKSHREEAKSATLESKRLRAKAKALVSANRTAKKDFYTRPGQHEFTEGIELV